jgi:hypothetical protein
MNDDNYDEIIKKNIKLNKEVLFLNNKVKQRNSEYVHISHVLDKMYSMNMYAVILSILCCSFVSYMAINKFFEHVDMYSIFGISVVTWAFSVIPYYLVTIYFLEKTLNSEDV